MGSFMENKVERLAVRVPVLRELWGMPFHDVVREMLFAITGVAHFCKDGGAEPPDAPRQVVAHVDEGHLVCAYQVLSIPREYAGSPRLLACLANIEHWGSLDQMQERLRSIATALGEHESALARTCRQLEIFNESRAQELAENERLARMPVGGLVP